MQISIITPIYNSAESIAQNVKSVLTQSYKNFNHIIVDNLSSDSSLSIIKNLYDEAGMTEKLQIISEKDNGIAEAFNKGIKAASGEIISILNSDDVFYDSEIFSSVIEAFCDQQVLIVHGNIYFIDPVHGSNIRHPLPTKIMKGVQYNHPAMFIRKKLYDDIGLYNVDFKVSMDYELYCRIANKYDPQKISVYLKERPLVKMYAGGMSGKNELKSIEEIKKALILHSYWNFEGKKFYYSRLIRTKVKKIFDMVKLQIIIRLWRRIKWSKSSTG